MYFGYKTQKALNPPPRESYDFTNPSFEAALLREMKMEQEKAAERNEFRESLARKCAAFGGYPFPVTPFGASDMGPKNIHGIFMHLCQFGEIMSLSCTS